MIRPAVVGDALRVAELEERTLGRDAWPFGLVAQGVAGDVPTTRWWVADEDGRLVGHVVLSVAGDVAEVQRLSVDADRRRVGLGGALLATAEEAARAAGAERVLLEVRADNVTAGAFYGARGYAEVGRRLCYYADGAAAVVLARPL